MRIIATLITMLLCNMFVHVPTRVSGNEDLSRLVFGVVPARSPEQILRSFGPVLSAMGKEVGVPVRVRGAPDYVTFLKRVVAGDIYDVILTGGDALQFIRKYEHYRPLVQMNGPGVFAVIVTREESGFHSLEALRGKARLATADPLAYSSGLGFRRLEQAGIDPETDIELVYVPSQSAALTSLIKGQVDAAIIMIPVIRSATPEIRQQLRILAETERAPPPAISVSTDIPDELAEKMQQFLVTLENHDEGRQMLKTIGWPGFAPVKIEDYDALDWAADSIEKRLAEPED